MKPPIHDRIVDQSRVILNGVVPVKIRLQLVSANRTPIVNDVDPEIHQILSFALGIIISSSRRARSVNRVLI